MSERHPEIITLAEWARRVGVSSHSAYRAAARDNLAGMFRIGKLVRVNWDVFVDSTAEHQAV